MLGWGAVRGRLLTICSSRVGLISGGLIRGFATVLWGLLEIKHSSSIMLPLKKTPWELIRGGLFAKMILRVGLTKGGPVRRLTI